ncbi:hypothetical protein QUF70_12850 [Desulfobacterales bacterium HSG17]|nr:hypothetical protein [Desulfobacterales bacterium HSG17]
MIAVVGMGGIGKTRLSLKLGMGGIGKTDLSVCLAKIIQDNFEFVIWRSLLNAPPVTEILSDLLRFISEHQDIDLPDVPEILISRLIKKIKEHRCLIILDNAESLFQGGVRTGKYKQGYEAYSLFFTQAGEVFHQSCILLTSREIPREVAQMATRTSPVRILALGGMKDYEGRKIFSDIGEFSCTGEEWAELVAFYNGNPLALELAAKHIQEVFSGDISKFLQKGKQVFGDFKELLDWHFDRLSVREREIVFWLAINREAMSIEELQECILSFEASDDAPITLQSLQRKLPVEKHAGGLFTLQPVLIEYTSERFIGEVCKEIIDEKPKLLNTHAMLRTQAKDFVRENQIRLTLKSVEKKLLHYLGSRENLESKLKHIIKNIQKTYPGNNGYAGGNIVNILCQMNTDIKGFNLSNLSICQAYLRGKTLQNVNFSKSDLSGSVFNHIFGSIYSLAYSPDGKILAASDSGNRIWLWDTNDFKLVSTLEGHSGWVSFINFSPDGKQIVSSGHDSTVRIWDVASGYCQNVLKGHTEVVRTVYFSPDGTKIASTGEDQTIRIWDVIEGKPILIIDEFPHQLMNFAFSPDGKQIVSGGHHQNVTLWNTSDGNKIRDLECTNLFTRTLTFSPDGHVIAGGGEDHLIRIWKSHSGKCLSTMKGHTSFVNSLMFNPDGKTLVSGGEEHEIRVWDIGKSRCINVIRGHTNFVKSVVFSPDGKHIASGSSDRTMRIWEARTGRCLNTLQGYTNFVRSVAFSPDGQFLAAGYDDNMVRIWDIKTFKCIQYLKGHSNRVRSVAFAPDSQTLVSGGDDESVRVWNIKTGKCLRKISIKKSWLSSVDFMYNDLENENIALTDSPDMNGTQQECANFVMSVAFSPDSEIIASGNYDQTVRFWNIQTGDAVSILRGHSHTVRNIAFSPDGKSCASASYDGTVKLWNVETGKCLNTFYGHTEWAWSVIFSPDAKYLASGGYDGTIRIWDITSGENRAVLREQNSGERSISFSPDGKYIASGSFDKVLKIWSLEDYQCVKSLKGHTDCIMSVSFSPYGKIVATGSSDGTIRLWDIQTGACVSALTADRPCEGMNIKDIKGINAGQKSALKMLGAVEMDRQKT